MKILYIGTPTNSDFMSDTLFHGLRSLFGDGVVDAVRIDYMYDDYPQELLKHHHGRGFTLTKKLKNEFIDRSDLDKKIKTRYFDYVVYGASFREYALNYLSLVTQYYPPNKIVYVNGADSDRGERQPQLINLPGIHFLRERFVEDGTFPISFAVPKEVIVNEVPTKEYYLMPIVPGVVSTLVYDTEQSYYEMYQKSLFGLTWKKSGWDCLRHYEILSQGCLPLFLDIHHLPTTMMKTYPRHQIEKLLDVAVSIKNFDKEMKITYDNNTTISNVDLSEIEFKDLHSYGYFDIANTLLTYTKEYLTTEHQAKTVVDIITNYN